MAEHERHLVEVALRDSRNIDVIMSMDRLVLLPAGLPEMKSAMQDMERVKDFAAGRVPVGLRDHAKEIFMEHANRLRDHLSQKKGR
ncbi:MULTISPECIES: hypothetical protein [Xanthomonas]|uniref:Uncharacterized protein n=1 Tax=Xanthomonas arboricola TaxID=56448 RepID=A0AB73H327_9XANT|nr:MULTISPECIES: hypothetical protein [Xanthomonas]MBB5672591.1 hypothetical protein [Xanthomonas arboricola]OCG90320.1 hypothetical protein LMG667_02565 [Xanthomonas euvesicatoria]PNV26501.1 hypothetical protein xavtCFBP7764_23275 [Xanthomonas citri]